MILEFNSINWADSDLEKIEIEYNCAKLTIRNSYLPHHAIVYCTGLAGISNLCIWDDTIIAKTNLRLANSESTDFLRNLYKAYNPNLDYGGRSMNDGFWELQITLVNQITFSIFCQKVEVHCSETL